MKGIKTISKITEEVSVNITLPDNTPDELENLIKSNMYALLGDYYAVKANIRALKVMRNINATAMQDKIEYLEEQKHRLTGN